jgi:hypothetical protein
MKSITTIRAVLALMTFVMVSCFNSLFSKNYVDITDCPKNVAQCEGIRTWKNGTTYEGEFKFGEPDGYGIMIWADGSYYEGEFRAGVRHGEGLQKNDDKSIYKGTFIDGFMHGQGVYSFPSGHQYIGEFYQDELDGYGSIQFTNGTAYTGYWRMGKPQGEGKFLRKDGSVITANFNKGQRDGEGSILYRGNVLKGNWKNNHLNGSATIKFANGDQLTCNWKKGSIVKQNCTYTFKDGKTENKSIERLLANGKTQENTAWVIYLEAMELKTTDQKDLAKVRFHIAKRYLASNADLQQHIRESIKDLKY